MKTRHLTRSLIPFLIGLCIALAIGVSLIGLIHAKLTTSYPLVTQTQDGIARFELTLPDTTGFNIGDPLPLYRYHGDIPFEFAQSRITQITPTTLLAEIRSSSILVNLGRHGKVLNIQNNQIEFLFDGGRQPFQPFDQLVVFQGGTRIGTIEVETVRQDEWGRGIGTARVLNSTLPPSSWPGLGISEYTVASVVPVFAPSQWVAGAEIALLALLIAAEAYVYFTRGFGLLALALRPAARRFRALSTDTKTSLTWVTFLLALVPFSWFMGQFSVAAFDSLKFHLPITRTLTLPPHSATGISVLLGLTLLTCAFVLGQRFLPALGQWLRYQPRLQKHIQPRHPLVFKLIVWSLNLIVVYVFAFTLVGFIAGNLNHALIYLAPSQVNIIDNNMLLSEPRTLITWVQSSHQNLIALNQFGTKTLSFDQTMAVVRLIVWSLTIMGCLIGYLHSVLKPFFITSIRNVDFTLTGWFVNGICYGPLLAGALWSLAPTYYGPLAQITAGPLFYTMVTLELITDLLYMFSVWNMGTKFGVMVDKGLVSTGFYAAVRHPSYTLEALMFFFAALRGLNDPLNWVGISVIFITYWLRAEREDQFMHASNPDYAAYQQRVKWKYIPGLI